MADNNLSELRDRVKRLEGKVDELEKKLKQQNESEEISNPETSYDQNADFAQHDERKSTRSLEDIELGEKWLNRIGIGLLLLGVAFLFKYSIDQGWLIPPVRSAFGFAIGLILFGSGVQMEKESKPLKQILAGGGIAAFYITGFATFQLYEFLPDTVVWAFMITVTLLALSISLQQNEAVLSVTGILGALGTPFMLYTGSGSVPALIIYTALVLGAAGYIYLNKGWRSLLWSMMLGGWAVVLVGIFSSTVGVSDPPLTDRWSLQAGIFICLCVFWGIPVVRDVLSYYNPEQWPDPIFIKDENRDENIVYLASNSVHVLTLAVPVFSLFLSMIIWDLSWESWGLISIIASVLVAGLYFPLQRISMQKMASVHGFSALALLTIGLVLLLEGNILFFALAVEAAGLRFVASKTGDKNISVSSHILFGIIAYWFIMLMGWEQIQESILDVDSFIRLAIIAIGGILVPCWLPDYNTKHIYGIAAHIFFLGWLYRLLLPLSDAQAWITVTWGLYAIILIILGFIRFGKMLRLTGMATIFLVVGKLFLVDMSQLQAIWRILLFIGFGAVFLLLGYYLQAQWNKGNDGGKSDNRLGNG